MMHKRVLRSLVVGLLAVVGLGLGVWAQTATLTVTSYSDAVRFAAQGSVKELRVEIISLAGQKVFDSGAVLGGALDWKMLNMQGQPVASGVYLYTVTMKDEFGNVTKRLGKLVIQSRRQGLASAPLLSAPRISQIERPIAQPLLTLPAGENLQVLDGSTTISGTGSAPITARLSVRSGPSDTQDIFHLYNPAGNIVWRVDINGVSQIITQGTVGGIQANGNPTGKFSVISNAPGGHSYTFNSNSDGSFGMADDTLGLNRWYITSSGNFGVGNVGPQAQFHVTNAANQPGLRVDSSDGTNALEIYNTGSGAATGLIFKVQRDNGNVYADGSYNCGLGSGCFNAGQGADVAERIDATEALEPGDVVEINPDQPGMFRKSREALSTRVAGVISTAPAVTLGNNFDATKENWQDDRPLLALAGRVPVKVTAKYGAIAVGDLLVSSPIPGYAMKCPERSQCIGAVIGKALEPLREGVGKIEAQVMLR